MRLLAIQTVDGRWRLSMKRSQIRADPAKVREWQQRSRRRLSPKSDKRREREATENRPEVRAAVFARDGYCLMRDLMSGHRCVGPMTPHHLRKDGQGGEYTEANLVTLCAGANTYVEDFPEWAHSVGLVVRAGETVEDVRALLRASIRHAQRQHE